LAKRLGFVAKLFAESIEEIDRGQVEAVTATGAGRFHVLLYGIVPQIRPVFAGVCVFRWDINIRESMCPSMLGTHPGRGRECTGDSGMARQLWRRADAA
jgi:phosphonate transport system permease protein